MHLLCKFHMCLLSLASYAGLNSLKLFISKLLMCDLDHFSKIQSHLMEKRHMFTCLLKLQIALIKLIDHILHYYLLPQTKPASR